MTRIIMADDHAIVRAGFRALLDQAGDYQVLAECGSVDEAREALARHAPDVLVLDISLPGGGLGLVPEVRSGHPGTAILILSMHSGEPYVSEALRLGVNGYVSKGSAADELLLALDAIGAGERYLSSDLRDERNDPELAMLSRREREVFLQLAEGRTPKQAAHHLGISDKTVYLHRDRIRRKMGVQNDLQLHQLALARGLLSPAP